MAQGDNAVQIVTSPINATTVQAAVSGVLAIIGISGVVAMASFNQGRSLAVYAVDKPLS